MKPIIYFLAGLSFMTIAIPVLLLVILAAGLALVYHIGKDLCHRK